MAYVGYKTPLPSPMPPPPARPKSSMGSLGPLSPHRMPASEKSLLWQIQGMHDEMDWEFPTTIQMLWLVNIRAFVVANYHSSQWPSWMLEVTPTEPPRDPNDDGGLAEATRAAGVQVGVLMSDPIINSYPGLLTPTELTQPLDRETEDAKVKWNAAKLQNLNALRMGNKFKVDDEGNVRFDAGVDYYQRAAIRELIEEFGAIPEDHVDFKPQRKNTWKERFLKWIKEK